MSTMTTTAFPTAAEAVSSKFQKLSAGELYVTDVPKDSLWEAYLAAFPAGTNPIFRVRTEHDCACCRNFVKNVGNVVAIVDGRIVSIWDTDDLTGTYKIVADEMSKLAKSQPIRSLFRSKERSYGAEFTWEHSDSGGSSIKWHHFHGKIASRHFTKDVAEVTGSAASIAGVFTRSLEELKPEALDTVLSLIADNNLYRGQEFQAAVQTFQKLQQQYLPLDFKQRQVFVWGNYTAPVSRIKNTVIGTLIQDLSEGKDIENAVKAFESKTAPTNYKRPKSLITPKQIAELVDEIEKAGLTDALQRRPAEIKDVSVNNVLYVDNAVRSQMKDSSIASMLMSEVKTTAPDLSGATPISMDDFVATVLPKAKAIDLLVEYSHLGNFVTLTAPAVANSGKLLKWTNDFAWSYDGNVTDSIKQRVKAAGGNVDAAIRASLAWFNTDDLDLHMISPRGVRVYYASKGDKRTGQLDVDMNNGFSGHRRDAVENICWSEIPYDGVWTVMVHQYRQREKIDVGFEMQFAIGEHVRLLKYSKQVTGYVNALTFKVKQGEIVDVSLGTDIVEGPSESEKWGIKTESLVRVDSLMLSPNYWDDNATGNKHWFFMLHGCQNPEPIRGLYNEFLHPSLEKHRKALEILGDKMKCPVSENGLSGVGFSSTRKDTVKVVVRTSSTVRAYNITF